MRFSFRIGLGGPAKLDIRYSNSEGMSYSDYEILIQDRVGGTS